MKQLTILDHKFTMIISKNVYYNLNGIEEISKNTPFFYKFGKKKEKKYTKKRNRITSRNLE